MLPEEPPMDPTDRQRFLRALRSDETFREEVRRELLTERLLELPDTVAALVDAVNAQHQQLAEHGRQIAELTQAVRNNSRQIAELTATVHEHSRQIAELTATVHEQREDIAELRRAVSALIDATADNRRDIAALIDATTENKREIAELRQEVASLTQVTRQLLGTVETGFAVMRDAVTALAGGLEQLRRDMGAGFAATSARFDRVDAEIIDIKRRLAS